MPPLLLCLALCLPAVALSATDGAPLAGLFADAGVAGTLVIRAPDGRQWVHDEGRAGQRFPAASTFKIPNTLILLEEDVLHGPGDSIAWDGTLHEFPDWNRDQTLASAFRVSCVWCYQHWAAQVGAAKYRRWLVVLGYGALAEPFDPVAFWLDGSLTISAHEQVAFLSRLRDCKAPLHAPSCAVLREVMRAEEGPGYVLYAKTGWAARARPQVGWYVGYVDTAAGTWLFATNITLRGGEDLPLRQQIARAGLVAVGALPPPAETNR